MANKRGSGGAYIERDRHGRERLVLRRSTSRGRSSERDTTSRELIDAEERYEALQIEVGRLQTRLSFEQRNVWNLQQENQRLANIANEHHHCGRVRAELEHEIGEKHRVEDDLDDLEKKFEKLEEKYRLMKRGLVHKRDDVEGYRQFYEEKVREVEILRARLAEADEVTRLHEGRIAEKDRTLLRRNQLITEKDTVIAEKDADLAHKDTAIAYLKGYLRTHGFHVRD
ncbi:hypothetical protein B0J14DRAFT_182338 [Halenospora varia]|nr:hypothetical protein B0J14DRAFT_182338 [Halenospora varia]